MTRSFLHACISCAITLSQLISLYYRRVSIFSSSKLIMRTYKCCDLQLAVLSKIIVSYFTKWLSDWQSDSLIFVSYIL